MKNNNLLVKEERESINIHFFIKMGTGYKLAKDVVSVLNENKIKYRLEKYANTYNFCFEDVIFSVTQIKYEDRPIKFTISRYTNDVRRIVDLIISKAKEHYVMSEENKMTLSFRREYILNNNADDLKEVHNGMYSKLVYNIPISKCYVNKITDLSHFSVRYTYIFKKSATLYCLTRTLHTIIFIYAIPYVIK